MFVQNQITVATVFDLNVNIQELATRVNSIIAWVEGMVGAQISQDEVQPTLQSLVDWLTRLGCNNHRSTGIPDITLQWVKSPFQLFYK